VTAMMNPAFDGGPSRRPSPLARVWDWHRRGGPIMLSGLPAAAAKVITGAEPTLGSPGAPGDPGGPQENQVALLLMSDGGPLLIAAMVVATVCGLALEGKEVPQLLSDVLLVISGYFFGAGRSRFRRAPDGSPNPNP
jgi:hypothetical protein